MSVRKSPNALRTIGEVAEDLGLATHVLRFWESKFKQIKPQKRRGRRYYRPEDVQLITQVKSLLYSQGFTIRGVQKFLVEQQSKNKAPKVAHNQNEPVSITQFEKFKTDIFSKISPENEALDKIPTLVIEENITKKESRFSDSQMDELAIIYQELKAARSKLAQL